MAIGVIGTGLMGEPLARRLLEQGHQVTAWNRSSSKTEDLAAEGASIAQDPAEVIQASDWIISMVANADALEEALLNPRSQAALMGRKIINMATIGPSEVRDLQAKLAQAGGELMECPVLGSIPEARTGTLLLLFGGTEKQLAEARPFLEAFGSAPRHVGELGQAAALKLALNQLIAGLTMSFALSLGLVQREGLDTELFMAILRDSALYAPTFDKKRDRMQQRHYDNPNFPLTHLLKDVDLIEDTARQNGLDTRLTQSLIRILEEAEDQGLGSQDYSVLYEIIHPSRS